jgi:putative copper resistance protein D
MIDLLIVARGVHFASTALVAGVALFQYLIAEPAFRAEEADLAKLHAYRDKLNTCLLVSLALAVLSGAVWLIALAMTIGGQGLGAVLSNGTVWLLLTETQFGHVWVARLALAAVLLGVLRLQRGSDDAASRWRQSLAALLAACLMGLLALAGHAGATPGMAGALHLTADILHLVVAGAWLGGLLPLWMLFQLAVRQSDQSLASTMQITTHRFSTLGLVSVGTLLATGLINTGVLVGSLSALLETDYGELLLLKIALFMAMVAIASVNRLRLTPRLPSKDSMRRLARNALAEIGLGLTIIAIVSVLGTLPPALHTSMHMH